MGETPVPLSTFARPSRSDLDVGGFHVAMDDAALMRVFERLGNLRGNAERVVGRQRRTLTRSLARPPSPQERGL